MKLRYLSYLTVFLMASCGPGLLDYSEEIGDTGLIYVDNSSIGRMILDNSDLVRDQPKVIDATVLDYRHDRDYVFGVRQIVNFYYCDSIKSESKFIGAEVTSQLEFFVISVSEDEPRYDISIFHDFFELKAFLESRDLTPDAVAGMGPDYLKEWMVLSRPLGECQNPEPI